MPVGLEEGRGLVVGACDEVVEEDELGTADEDVEELDALEVELLEVLEVAATAAAVTESVGPAEVVLVAVGVAVGVTSAVALVVDRTAADTDPATMRAAIVAVPTRPGRRTVLRTAALPSDTRTPIPPSAAPV